MCVAQGNIHMRQTMRTLVVSLTGVCYGDFVSRDMKLIGFDLVLVFISNGRIVRDDIALAKYAVKNAIKMAFVHSRCDETLRNLYADHALDNEHEHEAQKVDFVKRSAFHYKRVCRIVELLCICVW